LDRTLVRRWGLRMRRTFSNLTPVPQTPQDPRAKPTGWFAELCLFGLGLVALGHVYLKVGLGVGIVVHLTNRIHRQNAAPSYGLSQIAGLWR
jgi:hypothetical protein